MPKKCGLRRKIQLFTRSKAPSGTGKPLCTQYAAWTKQAMEASKGPTTHPSQGRRRQKCRVHTLAAEEYIWTRWYKNGVSITHSQSETKTPNSSAYAQSNNFNQISKPTKQWESTCTQPYEVEACDPKFYLDVRRVSIKSSWNLLYITAHAHFTLQDLNFRTRIRT